jgi:hypothetical protein
MTTAQLDHLRRIDAHLANLLSAAEKRTPGEWHVATDAHYAPGTLCVVGRPDHGQVGHVGNCIARVAPPECTTFVDHANAAYIASCAGNAEAGWKATRAAIACLLVICDPASGADFTNYGGETFLSQILAAFPNV